MHCVVYLILMIRVKKKISLSTGNFKRKESEVEVMPTFLEEEENRIKAVEKVSGIPKFSKNEKVE